MALNRREILAAPLALGAASLLGGAARAQGQLENTLVIRTTGGVFEAALKKNFFDPFTKATGVRVVPVAVSYGEMMAKATAMQAAGKVEWDIISPQYYELATLDHMLMDLGDCGAMPNVAKEGTTGACGRYGVLYLTGGQVLTWDPKAFPNQKPTSWADLWDVQKFPGRRGLPNTGSPWATMIASQLADGVAPDKLFPLDLDRVFRKLDQIKPHVAVWWRTGNQSQDIMRSGEVVMQLMWSGTAYAAKRSGISLEWTYNQAIADFGAWTILKGAPHPKAAQAFIDFYVTNPENHAAFSREMGYTTSSRAAAALLNAEEKKELISSDEVLKQIISPDAKWLQANRAAALERWNKWLAA